MTTTNNAGTPRTDAEAGFVLDANDDYMQEFVRENAGAYVPADFARQLETELNAANALLRADKERLDWLEALVWNQANAIELFEGDNGAIVLGHPDWEQSAESIRSVLDAARNATGQGGMT